MVKATVSLSFEKPSSDSFPSSGACPSGYDLAALSPGIWGQAGLYTGDGVSISSPHGLPFVIPSAWIPPEYKVAAWPLAMHDAFGTVETTCVSDNVPLVYTENEGNPFHPSP